MEYDQKAALYAGAVYPDNEGNESQLLLVEKPGKGADDTEKQMEAKAIALQIKRPYIITKLFFIDSLCRS